jgi:hypothetical protein
MSEYAGNIFFGFSASAPRGYLPDWFYFHVLCPSVPVNKMNGEVYYAPVGLRKIEAKLLENGFLMCLTPSSEKQTKNNIYQVWVKNACFSRFRRNIDHFLG